MDTFTHDGRSVFYRQVGDGPLLLILHGNTASSILHEGELAHFGRRYRAVAPDLPGVGQSSRIAAWPDDWWARGARDAAALAMRLGYSRWLVMGTSGGGIAALHMAIEFPGHVQTVVADSCVEHLPLDAIERIINAGRLKTPGQAAFWRAAHGEDWEQVVEADSALLLRFGQAGGDYFNGRLAEVRCPVLLTASLGDEWLPDVGTQVCRMIAQMPGGQAYLARSGGHPLMWSRPDEFRAAADCFLARIA
jgi:pimeloyl-ACP methyl ester carboxylesterase